MPEPQQPLHHFESYGKIANVLRALEGSLLNLFPEYGEALLKVIRQSVLDNSELNNWESVALIVDKGLARPILSDLAQTPFAHKGKIIIDPTGSTPECNQFDSAQILKASKERLIEVNEATDDVLMVMYGLDEMDRSSDFHLVQRHLRMAGGSLDMMMEEDMASAWENYEKGAVDEFTRNLILSKSVWLASMATLKANMNTPGHDISETEKQIRLLFQIVQNMSHANMPPQIQHQLECVLLAIRSIPEVLLYMGFSLAPFVDDEPVMLGGGTIHIPVPKQAPEPEPVPETKEEVQESFKRRRPGFNPTLDPD